MTCWFHPRYKEAKSPTYEKDGRKYSVQYGSGPVEGVLSKDTATVGSVNVKGQLFAEVSKVSFGPLNMILRPASSMAFCAWASRASRSTTSPHRSSP